MLAISAAIYQLGTLTKFVGIPRIGLVFQSVV